MKGTCHFCLTLLLCILSNCWENNGDSTGEADIDEIPIKDRFVYSIGDKLTYKGIDGITNTFLVKDYLFWTESGIVTDMFGGSHPWKRDQQRIIFESSSESWQKALSIIYASDSFASSCFIIYSINTIYDTTGSPYCWLLNGCNFVSSPIFAESGVKSSAISFNNNSYQKVYFSSRNSGNNSFTVYWNLKYGIIRFESVIEGKQEIWDLENPKF